MKHLLVSGLLLFAVGCGGEGESVSGTVKFSDGSPLTKGAVVFQSRERTYTAPLNENGEFVLKDASAEEGTIPPDSYRIYIQGAVEGKSMEGRMDYDAQGNYIPPPESDKPKPLVAAKFTNPNESGLVESVSESGSNTFNFTVEKP